MNNRLNLGSIGDDYVLGVACAKLGLVKYALETLGGLTSNKDRLGLFYRGVEDAAGCELSDLARDFWQIRKKNKYSFDMMVRGNIGRAGHAAVLEVIEKRDSYVYGSPVIQEFFEGMSSSLGVDRAFATEG
jgi:hypothetical protein